VAGAEGVALAANASGEDYSVADDVGHGEEAKGAVEDRVAAAAEGVAEDGAEGAADVGGEDGAGGNADAGAVVLQNVVGQGAGAGGAGAGAAGVAPVGGPVAGRRPGLRPRRGNAPPAPPSPAESDDEQGEADVVASEGEGEQGPGQYAEQVEWPPYKDMAEGLKAKLGPNPFYSWPLIGRVVGKGKYMLHDPTTLQGPVDLSSFPL
jgi:hypothetical protein